MASQKKLHSIWGRHWFCTYFTDTACCIHSGAFPSKEHKGRFNTVLNVSADMGTSGSLIRIPLCSSEYSMPERREGREDSRQDQSTAQILGQCRSPSSLEHSSRFTVLKQHWTNQGKDQSQGKLGEKFGQLSASNAVALSREL